MDYAVRFQRTVPRNIFPQGDTLGYDDYAPLP